MTRWEYKMLRADWFSNGLMVQPQESGKKLAPLEGELAQLGDEGWEVVSLQHAPMMPSGGRLVVLLKRPKAE